MLLTLIAISNAFATVTIDGYTGVCDDCFPADCGQVVIYTVATGGRPLADTCMSNNGYYSFDVDENDTYYIEIDWARNSAYDSSPGGSECLLTEWWKMRDRVTIIVATSDVERNLCADEDRSEPDPDECECYD